MIEGFPGGVSDKEPTCQCKLCKRHGFDPWAGKIPWRRAWQPTLVFLPGESRGQRSLVGYSPWGSQKVWHNWATKHARTHACTLRGSELTVSELRPAWLWPPGRATNGASALWLQQGRQVEGWGPALAERVGKGGAVTGLHICLCVCLLWFHLAQALRTMKGRLPEARPRWKLSWIARGWHFCRLGVHCSGQGLGDWVQTLPCLQPQHLLSGALAWWHVEWW